MKWSEGQQFENPPSGSFIGRCYAVIDLGTQQHSWQGETWGSRDVRIGFELPTELMTGKYNPDVKGKPFSVHMTLKQSLNPKSKLRPLLESWRGRKFTKEEIAVYDPKKMIGVPCRLALIENGDFINIGGISPLGRDERCPAAVNPTVFFSLEPNEFSNAVFAALGEKTREKISKSPEFSALTSPPQETEHDATPSDAPQDDTIPF